MYVYLRYGVTGQPVSPLKTADLSGRNIWPRGCNDFCKSEFSGSVCVCVLCKLEQVVHVFSDKPSVFYEHAGLLPGVEI